MKNSALIMDNLRALNVKHQSVGCKHELLPTERTVCQTFKHKPNYTNYPNSKCILFILDLFSLNILYLLHQSGMKTIGIVDSTKLLSLYHVLLP